jgi:hypothetical protein
VKANHSTLNPAGGSSAERAWPSPVALRPLVMAAAPLALLAAMLLHHPHGIDGGSWLAAVEAGPGRFYAAHLLMLVAMALFVPAVVVLGALVRRRRPAEASAATVLTLLGMLAIAVLVGLDFVAWQVARGAIEQSDALMLLEATATSPGVMAPLAVLLPGLVLGPAVFALALYRERIVAGWRAALIPLGFAGVLAGIPLTPVAIVAAASLVVALGGLGLAVTSGESESLEVAT